MQIYIKENLYYKLQFRVVSFVLGFDEKFSCYIIDHLYLYSYNITTQHISSLLLRFEEEKVRTDKYIFIRNMQR